MFYKSCRNIDLSIRSNGNRTHLAGDGHIVLGPQPRLDKFARELVLLSQTMASVSIPKERIQVDGEALLRAISLKTPKRTYYPSPWSICPKGDSMNVISRLEQLETKLAKWGSYNHSTFLKQHKKCESALVAEQHFFNKVLLYVDEELTVTGTSTTLKSTKA